MVLYECEKCGMTFDRKSSYIRHINKKNPCDAMGKKTIKKVKEEKEQAKIMAKAKAKEELDDKKRIEELTKNMEKIQKELNALKKAKRETKTTINGNVIGNNVNNVNNYQINLIAHGKEDLTFLLVDDQKNILSQGSNSVSKFVEMVHCNDAKPEYKNIYINSRKRLNQILTYNGDKWILCSQEFIDDLRDRGIDYIEEQFVELKENHELSKFVIARMERFIRHLDDDKTGKRKKKISNDIKRILYNNRQIQKSLIEEKEKEKDDE